MIYYSYIDIQILMYDTYDVRQVKKCKSYSYLIACRNPKFIILVLTFANFNIEIQIC